MKIGCAAFVGAFTIGVFAASPGAAQTIGGAVAVQREVSGQLSGSPRAIATGDDVHQNETIRTGAASSAELGFVDQTRLAVGASAAVKLDRFVFDPDRGARSVVLTATKGVARFVTGAGPSAVYQVRTPHATIGVRGTEFEVMVQSSRTVVVLGATGAVDVCRRVAPRTCQALTVPGDIAIVTATSLQGPRSAAAQSLDVAALRSALGGDTIALASAAAAPVRSRIWWFGKGPP
ncbi:MAG: FecR domain-containing protein [Microvirga sp.]